MKNENITDQTLIEFDIIPNILFDIFEYAKEMECSDVFLLHNEFPSFRIFRKVKRNEFLPKMTDEDLNSIIDFILKSSGLAHVKKDFTDLDFGFIHDNVRYRVNIYKNMGHYAVVFRILKNETPQLNSLNLPESLYELINFPNGLILVTGPTGSGKSSTLAALINEINKEKEFHIITLEDPIEYIFSSEKSIISQREVHKDVSGYADALKSALRESPDVIFVGEMRDPETIAATLTAAETGHLVFSTLHTTSASKTIDRIIDVFSADKQAQIKTQLASTLRAVISQILLPKADGTGMVPAIEVMIVNDAISTYIRNNQKNMIESEMQTQRKLGMISMSKSIENLVENGVVSSEEAKPYLKLRK